MDPLKGFLGLPGGFVDPGERAENAVLRECREEIGWAPSAITFLASFPNVYRYSGIDYHTCDLYFYARPDRNGIPERIRATGEAAAIEWITRDEIPFSSLAFQSLREAMAAYFTVSEKTPSQFSGGGVV
jgi:NAD+ diphosphatase